MDNQALFDPEGKPLESLYVFIYLYYSNLLKYGNEVTPIKDGVEDISVNPIDFEQFSFLETITVIDTSEQRGTRNVVWYDGYDEIKLKILKLITN